MIMDKKEIIKEAGRWNYISWLFFTKVLKKKAFISFEVFYLGGGWWRRYLDFDGVCRLTSLKQTMDTVR